MVSACSKRVWGVSEQELWRGCSPRRGPKLQTGSLMMNCKTQTQLPTWICLFAQQLFWAYRFRMIRTTEPSGLMKAQCSRSVSWLVDTPTLWDPSHRNLLYGEKTIASMKQQNWGNIIHINVAQSYMRPSLLPEVCHAIESRLLVENITLTVHNNRAVYKVFNPVWPTGLVQR